jgi:hypothetical protein
MALKKPAPKAISAAAAEAITQQFAGQTAEKRAVKTYDPNYPVFEVPICQKILVYIPNHTVTGPDGSTELRMDKFYAHPILDGRSFGNVRCINGIQNDDPQLNWDGHCPLCDGVGEAWQLYNKEYADVARSKGIDPDSPEANELLKQDRLDLVKARVIKEAERWYTFPIVVIECEEKDGVLTTNPKLDESGRFVGKPMWYCIRETTFLDKWVSGYDSLDGEAPTSPAGLWAVLNFTYTPKSGNPDKMGSAKSLKVTFKRNEPYAEWAKYYDQLTETWTPDKAMEVVVLDSIRSMEETQEVADSLLKPVRDKLALYNLGNSAAALPQNTNADNALANFGSPVGIGTSAPTAPTPAPAPAPAAPMPAPAPAPAMPMMGDINNVGVE